MVAIDVWRKLTLLDRVPSVVTIAFKAVGPACVTCTDTVSTFGRFGSIFDFALFIVHVPTKGLSAASAKPHVSKAIASVRIFRKFTL